MHSEDTDTEFFCLILVNKFCLTSNKLKNKNQANTGWLINSVQLVNSMPLLFLTAEDSAAWPYQSLKLDYYSTSTSENHCFNTVHNKLVSYRGQRVRI